MKSLGLHIRIETTMTGCIEKALRLELPVFQSFFVNNDARYIQPTAEDIHTFLKARGNFNELFVHASFWINLCHSNDAIMRLLKREILLAKKLEYTHLVVHPGSAKEYKNKIEGIDVLARRLNEILKREKDIQLILENTAHARYTIGSDLKDFAILQEKLDYEIFYCLDTAHAYACGYDIKLDPQPFIEDVKRYMDIDRVVLIHLNESLEPLGSRRDKHGIPGEGYIGIEALQRFASLDELKGKPIILELPPSLTEDQEIEVMKSFHK